MARRKYTFNQEKLMFERKKYSFRQNVIRSLPFFIIIALFTSSILFFGHDFLKSPKVKVLSESRLKLELQLLLMKSELGKLEEVIEDLNYNDDHLYRTYFEVDPLPASQREAGFGGNEKNNIFSGSKYAHILSEIKQSLEILAKKTVVQSQSFDQVIDMAKNKEKRLAARPAIQPVSINELIRFGSAFGIRMHPILMCVRMHEGIDLTCDRGTRVFATADGVVVESGYTPGGLGIRILIDHGYGYKTIYGHLEKVFIKKGENVKRGDVIGLVGSTGLSIAPHLHYEVIANGKKVNPINYYANDLSAEEFDKMISLLSKADPEFDIN